MKMVKPEEQRAAGATARGRWAKWAARLAALAIILGLVTTARAQVAATQFAPLAATQPSSGSLISGGLAASNSASLHVGQSSLITTRVPIHRAAVANPDIADYRVVAPTQVLIAGTKPGVTQLILWDDQERSQVVDVLVNPDMRAFQQQVKLLFPKANVEASNANGTIILHGRVSDLETATRIAQVASPYGTNVLNFLEVSGGQQITLQVRFAEVSRSLTQNLGFNAFATDGQFKGGINQGPGDSPLGSLLSTATGTGTTTSIPPVALFGSGKVGNTAFEFFLDALRQNNLLRVLAEPNLTVINGKKASFIAGGEFPVPVPQASGSGGVAITVDYKEFGVRLNFIPTVLGDGRVRLQVTPEVSDLDFTQSVSFNGFVIPSVTKRMVDTTVELAEGQTLALAGLLNNRVTANKSVTPLLGDIPILGALFRSVRYTRDETELVVLVTPRLVSPLNPGQVPPIPGEHWRYPNEAELFLGADLGGPALDTAHAPTIKPPPDFHGRYGFSPAEPASAK